MTNGTVYQLLFTELETVKLSVCVCMCVFPPDPHSLNFRSPCPLLLYPSPFCGIDAVDVEAMES